MEADPVGEVAREIIEEIRALDGTIRARLLYERG